MTSEQSELLERAKEAAGNAYAPYSGYRVGAAVLAAGEVFDGANVENASANLGICAERVAMAHAMAHAAGPIEGLAIACPDARADAGEGACMPCGACRQWLAELAPDAWVVTSRSDRAWSVAELLPEPFVFEPPDGGSD